MTARSLAAVHDDRNRSWFVLHARTAALFAAIAAAHAGATPLSGVRGHAEDLEAWLSRPAPPRYPS